MKREEIKSILPNITNEELDKIMAINGADIERAKGDSAAFASQIESLTAELSERNKQLSTLKEHAKDNEELTAKIAELQETNKASSDAYEAKINAIKRDYAMTNALRDAKARNTKAVLALLDMDKITMEGETLKGLDEQISALKKDEGTSFLFEKEQSKVPYKSGYVPTQGGGGASSESTGKSLTELVGEALKTK